MRNPYYRGDQDALPPRCTGCLGPIQSSCRVVLGTFTAPSTPAIARDSETSLHALSAGWNRAQSLRHACHAVGRWQPASGLLSEDLQRLHRFRYTREAYARAYQGAFRVYGQWNSSRPGQQPDAQSSYPGPATTIYLRHPTHLLNLPIFDRIIWSIHSLFSGQWSIFLHF